MKEIGLDQFGEELASLTMRPGLLFGPGVTRAPGILANEFHTVFDKLGLGDLLRRDASDSDYPAAVDAAFERRPDKQELIKDELVQKIKGIEPSLDLRHLVRAGWSAYVSLTEDILLEEALRNYADSQPSSRAVTIIDHTSITPPTRSYPIYKLLGNPTNSAEDSCVCLSDVDLALRRQVWPTLIRSIANYLREAPLVVLGFTSTVQRLRDALALLAGQASPRVTKLRLLKNDPCLQDPTIKGLLKKFDVALIDADIRDLSERVGRANLPGSKRASLAQEKSALRAMQDAASRYDSPIAVVPPAGITSLSLSRMELPGAIDSLFRPAALDWKPFEAALDLRRDCTDQIVSEVRAQTDLSTVGHPRLYMLVGEAGVGKTSIAKRVALEVSSDSTLVLWCRRIDAGGWAKTFREWLPSAFTLLNKEYHGHYKKLVLMCDDPWGLRIDASDALVALERSPIPAVLVVSLRNTDRYVMDLRSTVATAMAHKEIDIPFELSDGELDRLALTLHKIDAVATLERGHELVRTVYSKNARDILCSLWYLIPETKSQLAESLKSEYFRLGELMPVADLAQRTQLNGAVAHKAYEFVTVCSRLDIGLPIEILVNALGIDYSEWIGSLEKGRPLWGLLYDTVSDDGSTVVYYTRNEIVTRVLIDLVNGGLHGHNGEARVLKTLISDSINAGKYRSFVIDVLVRARSKITDIFTYEQGRDLYEAALAGLATEDRLIEHHFGIWIQDKGPKDGTAYRQLEKALHSSAASGSDRDAPREHIHASMAAATLAQIRGGMLDWNQGAERVRHHLRLASSPTFFNAHGSHVAANLLVEAAQLAAQKQDRETADKFTIDAFEEIEKAYQTVGAKARASFQYNKTLGLFADLQRRILGLIPDASQLRTLARDIFSRSGRQTGFELAARRLLVEAKTSGKGKDFNEVNDYLNECMEQIEQAKDYPSASLLAVRIDLMIRWKLHGLKEVNWEAFRDDLLDVLENPKFRDDALKRFFLGVAHFHLGESTESNAEFAQLRRDSATNHKPNDIRAYFQDRLGNARRVQGTARYVNSKGMISIPELQLDAPLRNDSRVATGLTHVYIGFSFNGPIAVGDAPEEQDLILN